MNNIKNNALIIKLYTDTVNNAPGTYVLGIQFNVATENTTKSYLPAPLSSEIQNKSNFAGIVELYSYVKD